MTHRPVSIQIVVVAIDDSFIHYIKIAQSLKFQDSLCEEHSLLRCWSK